MIMWRFLYRLYSIHIFDYSKWILLCIDYCLITAVMLFLIKSHATLLFLMPWTCTKWYTPCCSDEHRGLCISFFSLPPPFFCLTHHIIIPVTSALLFPSCLLPVPFCLPPPLHDASPVGPRAAGRVPAPCWEWNINQALMLINCPAQ